MDITTSGISFGKMSYPCHIHVISVFQKRYIWIYLVYPKLKKFHLVYTWYIFSCHIPCLSMSYPCHKFVKLSGAGHQMKFSRKLQCDSSSASRGTTFIKHNNICLPPQRPRTPPLPPALGGDAAGAVFCGPPPARGPPARGPACRRGPPAWGPPAYGASWECEIVPGPARTLGAVTLIAPATPSTPS